MEIVLGVLALLVVTGIVAAFIAARPSRGSDLDPPPPSLLPPQRGRHAPRPRPRSQAPGSRPRRSSPARRAEVVAEAEAVLAAPRPRPSPQRPPVEAGARRARAGAARSPAAAPAPSPGSATAWARPAACCRATWAPVRSRAKIDDETWDELEEALIRADVGVDRHHRPARPAAGPGQGEGITTADGLVEALKDDLKKRLTMADRSLRLEPGVPNVWLFVGVNGVGKTTTIGKVGHQQVRPGRDGDHGRRRHLPGRRRRAARAVVEAGRGRRWCGATRAATPGAVVFDAVERAAARDTDLVLADTAGRLHTKVNLMEELKKVRRVADKPPGKVTEVLLVIDATTGQNGLVQARQFLEAVDVTGVVLTKLDGTAKGGIVLAIQSELGIPIKLVGLGETADDLIPFDPDEFVDALFS